MDRLTRPVFCDLMCGRDQATYRTGVVVSKRRVRSNRHHLPTSVNRTPRPKKLGRSVVSAILLLVGGLLIAVVSGAHERGTIIATSARSEEIIPMRFTKDHEWVVLEGDVATIGITATIESDSSGRGFALEQIVRNIPDTNVRMMILESVENEQLFLSWTATGVEAAFQLTPTPDGTLFPIITFQPAFISAAQQDTGANTQAQLVIYHEFAHYLQWQSGAFPDETFMPERMAINRDVCTKKWYAERDAYHQECEFARENGLLDRLDPNSGLTAICRTSLEEFDDNLKRILPRGDASAAACVTYWRGL